MTQRHSTESFDLQVKGKVMVLYFKTPSVACTVLGIGTHDHFWIQTADLSRDFIADRSSRIILKLSA
ncbi:hypothetical protein MJO28_011068 [Puccinia striiformis f. sp. tritici]|uniref:Uncharacterized protein n=1 Tax=Puccinia striiformis f. sp. tritici TaxID=168172 RepID=A0ACC0E388_9BASI|nr:hypothetical protein MJO28_011068 [Puccinia striiformis f. sp. tritici]